MPAPGIRVVEDVVDNLRAAGVNEIGLITEEPHDRRNRNKRQPLSREADRKFESSNKRGNELWQWQ